MRTRVQKMIINSEKELRLVAEEILKQAGNRKVFAFYGEMGAGKTTLIKALCQYMQVENVVNSPTFAIVNEYFSNEYKTIYHFDFYRIDTPEEAFDMGYEEYFYSGYYCFIEWPEKIEPLLPDNVFSIKINILGSQKREFQFI